MAVTLGAGELVDFPLGTPIHRAQRSMGKEWQILYKGGLKMDYVMDLLRKESYPGMTA